VYLRPLRSIDLPSLASFTHLHDLTFSCNDLEGEYTAPDFEKDLDRLRLEDLQIRHLEVKDLTWPDYLAMTLIACHFPKLETLKLAQQNIWCGMCNTCSFVSFDTRTDQRLTYGRGDGLPLMYARLLAPLNYLHTVIIDCPVFFGDVPFHPFSETINWSGECGWCMSNIQEDPDFQLAWVTKKQTAEDKDVPLKRPPSLRQVIWNLQWSEGTIGHLAQASDAEHVPFGEEEEDYTEVGTDVVSSYEPLALSPS